MLMASKGHLGTGTLSLEEDRDSERCYSLLHTDTTTDTQFFRKERLLVVGVHFDTKLSHLDDGT